MPRCFRWLVIGLPDPPADADELFYVAARDVARLLIEAGESVAEQIPTRTWGRKP